MKIRIRKVTGYKCEYTITRDDGSEELIALETKTFLVHDVCHYVVEKHLEYPNGFWGMLAQGYSFKALFGKDNPQTEDLRFIEKIVGPVQSVYQGFIQREDLPGFIAHIDFAVPETILSSCIAEIEEIMRRWEQLPVGGQLQLEGEFGTMNSHQKA